MSNVKILTAILGFLTLVLLLVLLRSFDFNRFSGDLRNAVRDAATATVSADQLKTLAEPYHIIVLDGKTEPHKDAISVPFSELLQEVNLKMLRELNGKILLFSEIPGTSTKAWVILNQLKFKVAILSDDPLPEALKYEFQPDTTVRLEFN